MLPAHGPEKALQVAQIGQRGPELRPGAALGPDGSLPRWPVRSRSPCPAVTSNGAVSSAESGRQDL
jgi:hypothetical protein